MSETSAPQFTTNWLAQDVPAWNRLIEALKPRMIVEIGSFEGRSACHTIERATMHGPIDLFCVDSWEGGDGLPTGMMGDVERRFDHNVALAVAAARNPARVRKLKGYSNRGLIQLISELGHGSVDMIYIDGSHQAPDVLVDSVLAFQLLRVGGLMIFDDYLWSQDPEGQQDSLNMAKPAIDAFLNIFQRKMSLIPRMPLYQLYAKKIAN